MKHAITTTTRTTRPAPLTLSDLQTIAQKAVAVTLRMLHAKTGAESVYMLQMARFFDKDDSTIAHDLEQAAFLSLFEHCVCWQYEPYETIGYRKSRQGKEPRAFSPFSQACAAVQKTIREYSGAGMTGQGDARLHVAMTRVSLSDLKPEDAGTYTDDLATLAVDTIKTGFSPRFIQMIDLLADGYTIANIAERMNISKAYAYEMRDKIRKELVKREKYAQYK